MSGELAELNSYLVDAGLSQGESAVAGMATGGAFGAIVGAFVGAAAIFSVVLLVVWLLQVIAGWRIFTKAGEAGWKAIIPIYNDVVAFRIAGRKYWRYFVAILGYAVCNSIASNVEGVFATILMIASLVFIIWALVEAILMANGLAKNFGKGTGFTVGLVLLPVIFTLILGFGSSQYVGRKE